MQRADRNAEAQAQLGTLLSLAVTTLVRVRFSSRTFGSNNTSSPLTMQPSVLMNRFIINLKSLSTASSSQGSSAQPWSRFSAPNFRIPDSFLGNISEDLQHGRDPADDDLAGDQEMDAVSLSIQGPPEPKVEATPTAPAFSRSRPMNAQVTVQIDSGSKPC